MTQISIIAKDAEGRYFMLSLTTDNKWLAMKVADAEVSFKPVEVERLSIRDAAGIQTECGAQTVLVEITR